MRRGNEMKKIVMALIVFFLLLGIDTRVYAANVQSPHAVTALKAEVINGSQVKLTWNSTDYPDGFLVYRKKASESQFSYRYLVNGNSFTDTTAEAGEYNFYRIYPFNLDNSGKRVVGSSTTYVYAKPTAVPKPVTGLKASLEYSNQVRLSWNAAPNATGYIIYRKAENETKFTYRYMVSGTSFLDTAAVQEKYNFYRVYPYVVTPSGTRVMGSSTAYVYARPSSAPSPVTGLKASLEYSNQIRLKWNASSKATGYIIYRKTQYESGFTYRYMVSGTSFLDTDPVQGQYNYYRVYPYYADNSGKRYMGKSTNYVYAYPLGLPETCDLYAYNNSWDGGVEISWDLDYSSGNSHSIDGFIVYRRVGSSGEFQYRAIVEDINWWGYYFEDTTASYTEYNYYKVYPFYYNNGKRQIGPCQSYTYGKAKIPAVYSFYSYEQINQVRLQWEKNSAIPVDGYDIYRKQGNGSFKYIGTTSKTEYIDISASKTTMNYYRVYPYRKIGGIRVQGLSNSYQYGKAQNYSLGQAIADYGWQFIGTPYEWGGNDLRKGVDCSGFTTQVHAQFGIHIPRTSYTQENGGVDIGRDLSNAKPGDVICYCYDLSEESCHVAIYVGNGRMINSTTTYKLDGTVVDGIQIGYADYMIIKTIRRYW